MVSTVKLCVEWSVISYKLMIRYKLVLNFGCMTSSLMWSLYYFMGWLLLLGVRTLGSAEGLGVIIKTALGLELRMSWRPCWFMSVTNKFHSGKLCSAPPTKFFPYTNVRCDEREREQGETLSIWTAHQWRTVHLFALKWCPLNNNNNNLPIYIARIYIFWSIALYNHIFKRKRKYITVKIK